MDLFNFDEMNTKNSSYIISEIGVNHNGSVKLAKELIKKSKWAGADAVKFQLYDVEQNYNKQNTSKKKINWSKKLLLPLKYFYLLKKYAEKYKLDFICSVFDTISFKNYLDLKPQIVKLPSSEVNNFDLLNQIKNSNLKVIFSSGIIRKKRITEIKKILQRKTLKHKILKKNTYCLYCVSKYPSVIADYNMRYYKDYFEKKFFNGLSDHTKSNDILSIGSFIGCEIIEKHIMLEKTTCPDKDVSITPIEFKKMVSSVRAIEQMLRENLVNTTDINFIKKGVYSKKIINKGDIFSSANIMLKKPLKNNGIENIKNLYGKKSNKRFNANSPIIK